MSSKICVIGSSNIDQIAYTKNIPADGETLFGDSFQMGFGGKGANQAVMAGLLGADVYMITCLGDDVYKEMTINNYEANNVNTDHIQLVKGASGVAPIWVDATGQNRIIVIPGANNEIDAQKAISSIEAIGNISVLVGQCEIPMEVNHEVFQYAKSNAVTTIFNPAPASDIKESDFKCIDYFTPNETEASYYLDKKVESKTEIEEAAKTFLAKGVKNIVITLGPKGLYFANSEESFFIDVYSLKNKVIDTTGAGDAFNGAFAYALSNKLKIKDALEFSNKVAAISTTKAGAANAMPKLDEVEVY